MTQPSAKEKDKPPPTEEEAWMGKALEEAQRGRPSPNPHVGAVVVKDGQIVGSGHHVRAGEDHAEIAALKAAGDAAEGATVFVTLEPCNHTGRTPPCTDALIAAKVARVVVGTRDPNPHVPGGGLERLKAAGINVSLGVRELECRKLIAPWTKFISHGVPYVTLKLALSLDGRIATRTGASKWVTGSEARARVHELRVKNDAVAIGIGTALADDPRLTVRDVSGPSPMRVVFDTRLRLPLHSKLVTSSTDTPTLVLCSVDAAADQEAALAERGVQVLRAQSSAEGRIDVHSGLKLLAQRGIVRLMVEGGAELAGSMLAARQVDELHAFIAPSLLGPRGRPGAVDWAGPDTPADAPQIAHPHWELVGRDAHVYGRLRYPEK